MNADGPLHRTLFRALGLGLCATVSCSLILPVLALFLSGYNWVPTWVSRAEFFTSYGSTPGDPLLAWVVLPAVFAPWCCLTIACGELAPRLPRWARVLVLTLAVLVAPMVCRIAVTWASFLVVDPVSIVRLPAMVAANLPYKPVVRMERILFWMMPMVALAGLHARRAAVWIQAPVGLVTALLGFGAFYVLTPAIREFGGPYGPYWGMHSEEVAVLLVSAGVGTPLGAWAGSRLGDLWRRRRLAATPTNAPVPELTEPPFEHAERLSG
jgi:hypothetical protein